MVDIAPDHFVLLILKPYLSIKMNHPNFTQAVEITRSAFYLLRGNDEKSWRDYGNNEHAEWTVYINEGVRLLALCNFLYGVTQYYVQDINA